MDVSVITLTWNSEKYISAFIGTLINDLRNTGWEYEIFVIDNGSKDSTLDILHSWELIESNLRVIKMKKNVGTTRSRNIGLRLSSGKYIVILDSDMEIPKGSLEKWIEGFKIIPSKNIGLIAPKLVYPDGTLQISARRFPTIASKFARLFDIEWLQERTDIWPEVIEEKIVPVPYAISAAWIVKREVFEDIGLFDEHIFYAPEDAEFCTRMWSNNWEVWYYPKAQIIHHTQRITKKRPFSKLGIKHIEGLLYYWIKYGIYYGGRVGK